MELPGSEKVAAADGEEVIFCYQLGKDARGICLEREENGAWHTNGCVEVN